MKTFLSKYLLILALSLFTLSACAPQISTRQSEQLSQAAYVIPAAFKAKRIDIADIYSRDLTRLAAPPRNSIAVNPVLSPETGEPMVILPESLSGEVVLIGSDRYKIILKNSKDLAAQVKKEQAAYNSFEDKTNKELRRKEEAQIDLAKNYLSATAKIKELQVYKIGVWAMAALAGLAGACYLAFIINKKTSLIGWMR